MRMECSRQQEVKKMVVVCMVCLKQTIKAGPVGKISHGCCEGFCSRVLDDWSDDPQGMTLPEYYAAVLEKKKS